MAEITEIKLYLLTLDFEELRALNGLLNYISDNYLKEHKFYDGVIDNIRRIRQVVKNAYEDV